MPAAYVLLEVTDPAAEGLAEVVSEYEGAELWKFAVSVVEVVIAPRLPGTHGVDGLESWKLLPELADQLENE